MSDKQYLDETILEHVLQKLAELSQQSQEPICFEVLKSLIEQAQQATGASHASIG